MITTTIRIDDNTHYTATSTQIKKLRGGFSEYVELLIIADLNKKKIPIVEKAVDKLEEGEKV